MNKQKIYLCDCKNYDTNNTVMHPTKINKNGQCIECDHYAFYGEYNPKENEQKHFHYTKEEYEEARLMFIECGNIMEISKKLGIGKNTLYKWKNENGWCSTKYSERYPSEFIHKVKFYYQNNKYDAKKTAEFFQIKTERVERWSLLKKWKGKKHRTTQEKINILNKIKINADFKKQADKEKVNENTVRNWYRKLIGETEYKIVQGKS